jgi:hypothetical protein
MNESFTTAGDRTRFRAWMRNGCAPDVNPFRPTVYRMTRHSGLPSHRAALVVLGEDLRYLGTDPGVTVPDLPAVACSPLTADPSRPAPDAGVVLNQFLNHFPMPWWAMFALAVLALAVGLATRTLRILMPDQSEDRLRWWFTVLGREAASLTGSPGDEPTDESTSREPTGLCHGLPSVSQSRANKGQSDCAPSSLQVRRLPGAHRSGGVGRDDEGTRSSRES